MLIGLSAHHLLAPRYGSCAPFRYRPNVMNKGSFGEVWVFQWGKTLHIMGPSSFHLSEKEIWPNNGQKPQKGQFQVLWLATKAGVGSMPSKFYPMDIILGKCCFVVTLGKAVLEAQNDIFRMGKMGYLPHGKSLSLIAKGTHRPSS